jgi:hypothetical protein
VQPALRLGLSLFSMSASVVKRGGFVLDEIAVRLAARLAQYNRNAF